jgi:hypothetical protein
MIVRVVGVPCANFAHKNERCTVVKKMRHCCCVGGNGSGSGRSRWKADVRSPTYFTTPFSFVSRNGGDGCYVEADIIYIIILYRVDEGGQRGIIDRNRERQNGKLIID